MDRLAAAELSPKYRELPTRIPQNSISHRDERRELFWDFASPVKE
jgi:hypothetical protein